MNHLNLSPSVTVYGPGDQHASCRSDETLLDAWQRQGIAAKFSCRGGSCHSCMLRCVAGTLPERAQLGVPAHLQKKGYFLPCLCIPTESIQLADVCPQDFITHCVVESSQQSAEGWILHLEPITRFNAEPGQYTCVRVAREGGGMAVTETDQADDWVTPWRITNRQDEDFYLHLLLELAPQSAVPEAIRSLQVGDSLQLRPSRTEAILAAPTPTQESAPIAPDLWVELGNGAKVRAALVDFYDRVYEDSVLAPFFRGITKERLTGKQYAFLHDEMTGGHDYFGDNMSNTHHWMVISDAVFEHRQRLMVTVLHDHGLSESQIERWMHYEERHRGDIVKDSPRDRLFEGQVMPVEGYEEETLSCGAMCDHCGRELHPGEVVLYHVRLGNISCSQCRSHGLAQVK